MRPPRKWLTFIGQFMTAFTNSRVLVESSLLNIAKEVKKMKQSKVKAPKFLHDTIFVKTPEKKSPTYILTRHNLGA